MMKNTIYSKEAIKFLNKNKNKIPYERKKANLTYESLVEEMLTNEFMEQYLYE